MDTRGANRRHPLASRLIVSGIADGLLGALSVAPPARAASPEAESPTVPSAAFVGEASVEARPANAWYAAPPDEASADGLPAWPDAGGPATPGQPSVVSVFTQHAARPLAPDKMDKARGGFLLFSSTAMDVRIAFAAKVNGEFAPVMVDPSIYSAPGILTRLADGVVTVAGTNRFSGLLTAVQNNQSFQNLQTTTYATFDLTGSMASFRASQFRSQLNYTMSSLGH